MYHHPVRRIGARADKYQETYSELRATPRILLPLLTPGKHPKPWRY